MTIDLQFDSVRILVDADHREMQPTSPTFDEDDQPMRPRTSSVGHGARSRHGSGNPNIRGDSQHTVY